MARKSESKNNDKTELMRIKDEVAGSRLLVLLCVSIAYIFLLMFLHNAITGITHIVLAFAALKVIFFVSIGLLVLAIIFFIVRRSKKVDEELKVFTSTNVLATFIVFLLASALVYKYDVSAIKLLYVAIPVWFIIYMIYKMYIRDFFTVTLSCTIGIAVLFFMYHVSLTATGVTGSFFSTFKPAQPVLIILFVLIAALFCFLAAKAKKNKGFLFKDDKIKIAAANANYVPIYIAPAITAVLLLVSFAYSQVLFYGIFLLAAFWLIMFIYYTYSMMKK